MSDDDMWEDDTSKEGTRHILAWSSDMSQFACCQVDYLVSTTTVWDSTTGKVICLLRRPPTQTHFLRFDDEISNHLHTPWGVLDTACPDLQPSPHLSAYCFGSTGYKIYEDYVWIVYNGVKILWLPPEYRPTYSSMVMISGALIVIASQAKKILFLQFTEHNPIVPP